MEPISHSSVKALRAVPDLAPLGEVELLRIVGASSNLFWTTGTTVFDKGDPSEALYIVLSGAVRIYDREGDAEVHVADVGPGGFFGELSLVRDEHHTKGARATEDTELMVVPRGRFAALLDSDAALASHFKRLVAERDRAFSGS